MFGTKYNKNKKTLIKLFDKSVAYVCVETYIHRYRM